MLALDATLAFFNSITDVPCHFRLGLLVDDNNMRCAEYTEFIDNIDEITFLALFQALIPRADTLTSTIQHTEHWYLYHDKMREVCKNNTKKWFHTQYSFIDYALLAPCWFDIMAYIDTDLPVHEPDSVREAKAIAKRIAFPYQDERTRRGFPCEIHAHHVRTMTFLEAPGWEVVFERVSVSRYDKSDTGLGIQYSLLDGGRLYHINLRNTGMGTSRGFTVLMQHVGSSIGYTTTDIGTTIEEDALAMNLGETRTIPVPEPV